MPLPDDDASLVEALRQGQRRALGDLFDRYGTHVYRVLLRTLGPDVELPDLVHDVFLQAYEGIDGLHDPSKLKSWLASMAVFTARGCIRKRQRWRWFAREEEAAVSAGPGAIPATAEVSAALRMAYVVLNQLPVDERIAFALRHIDGMKLEEVAEACDTSLATVKRRLQRGQARFLDLAAKYPALGEWLERGSRWNQG
jgi:RNA polymerase sigma-70 factor (ECF subfamily)